MKSPMIRGSLAAVLAGLLAGCGGSESEGASAATASPPADADWTSADEAVLDEVDVPTDEEAQAQAEAAIDEDNVDAEWARLKAEIEADADG